MKKVYGIKITNEKNFLVPVIHTNAVYWRSKRVYLYNNQELYMT
jgi:hypothetical protein